MTLTYKLELEDWLAFSRFYRQTSPIVQKHVRRVKLWLMFVISIMIFTTTMSERKGIDAVTIVATLAGMALFYLFMSKVLDSSFEKQARKIYASEQNKALRQTTTLTIAPDHIASKSSLAESTIKWPMVEGIATTAEYVFIQLSASNPIVVPKRAFDSEEQRQQCIELLQHYHSLVYA